MINDNWLTFSLQLLEIAWINLLLSGDNAVVIAMACRSLPKESQRIAMLLGSGAAIGLRVVFTVLVMQLLGIPALKLIGGVLLLWISVKLVLDESDHKQVKAASSIWLAIGIITMSDAIMSLDNVLAIAAAANGSWLLIIIGLVISVPLIMFGSALVIRLIERFPIIVWAGCLILAYAAFEIALEDVWLEHPLAALFADRTAAAKTAIAIVGSLLTLAIAGLLDRRQQLQH